MAADSGHLWTLLIAFSALAGWWLAVRPGASYRGVSSSVSILIILMAALLSALAIHQPRAASAHPPGGSASLMPR